MKKIIFILAMLYSPSLLATTLTTNTVPYVCQGGTSPQLCNSNITTDSSGNASSILPSGTILTWAGTTVPLGFLWCNGQTVSRTTYSGLFAVIGTTYGAGDGSATFNLPDTRGRTIVGVDAMGGSSAVSRITQWGTLPTTIGGTFGEDAHRQTIAELAPHAHVEISGGRDNGDPFYDGNNVGGNKNPFTNVTAPQSTASTGGNGDSSGLGTPSNVVQPSIAMGCIIKY